jgi:hypothetical protein
MSQDNIHFIVIGIESGSISSNKIVILGTFSKVEKALEFIKLRSFPNIFSNVDILETFIDKPNLNIENYITL